MDPLSEFVGSTNVQLPITPRCGQFPNLAAYLKELEAKIIVCPSCGFVRMVDAGQTICRRCSGDETRRNFAHLETATQRDEAEFQRQLEERAS